MEESNQKSSHPPKNVCEKLYRAIFVSSPIRTFHRISFPHHHHETSSPDTPSLIISHPRAEAATPVKADHSKTPLPRNLRRGIQVTEAASEIEAPATACKSNGTRPEKPAPAVKLIRQNKPGKIIEDRFSEFIDRAKLKMSMSNVGEEKISSTVPIADHKDHFSEYIRRAKQRLRNTSTVKPRNESFNIIETKRGA